MVRLFEKHLTEFENDENIKAIVVKGKPSAYVIVKNYLMDRLFNENFKAPVMLLFALVVT